MDKEKELALINEKLDKMDVKILDKRADNNIASIILSVIAILVSIFAVLFPFYYKFQELYFVPVDYSVKKYTGNVQGVDDTIKINALFNNYGNQYATILSYKLSYENYPEFYPRQLDILKYQPLTIQPSEQKMDQLRFRLTDTDKINIGAISDSLKKKDLMLFLDITFIDYKGNIHTEVDTIGSLYKQKDIHNTVNAVRKSIDKEPKLLFSTKK
jgi:hypothetical protein